MGCCDTLNSEFTVIISQIINDCKSLLKGLQRTATNHNELNKDLRCIVMHYVCSYSSLSVLESFKIKNCIKYLGQRSFFQTHTHSIECCRPTRI